MKVFTTLIDITQPEQINKTTQKTSSLFCIFFIVCYEKINSKTGEPEYSSKYS